MRFYFVLIFLFASFLSTGQDRKVSYHEESLKTVFDDIETVFEVRFSYNEAILKSKKFTFSENIFLEALLDVLSEEFQFSFRFLDNENIIVKEKSDTEKRIELEEVVVLAEYLTSGFRKNKEDGSMQLQPNKLGILPGLTEPDILQSLQLLPGISSPTESAANLHIRGGTPDQNLILWDGIKMYHQGHLFGSISPFNPYITDRVNVQISGTSSEFGDRISSVIDIHSDDKIPEETSFGAGANFLHTDAFVKVPLVEKKLGLIVSGRRALTDIFNSRTFQSIGDKVFQNTKIEELNASSEDEEEALSILENRFLFTDFNTKLIFQPNEKNKILLSGLFVDNQLNYANVDDDEDGSRDRLDLKNYGASLQWQKQFDKKWKSTVAMHYSNYDSNYTLEEFRKEEASQNSVKKNVIKDFGVSIKVDHKINDKHTLSFGHQISNYNVDYTLKFSEDSEEVEETKQVIQSTFLEDVYRNKKWFVRLGTRVNFFYEDFNLGDLQKVIFEPRFYANYDVNAYLKLKTSAEIKTQAISQLVSFEFNELGLNTNIWALSDNDDIPILNSKQATAGFLFSKNGWKIDVEGYYKFTTGLTSFTKGFITNNSEEYTSGNSTTYGVDILLKKRIQRWRTWLSYSLSKNTFEFENLQQNAFPGNFDQRHVLTWSNTFTYKKLKLSLGWNYTTGRPFSNPSSIRTIGSEEDAEYELVYNSQNNRRLNAYHRMDASAMYDFYFDKKHTIKARFGVSIQNIIDRENEIDKTFFAESSTEFTQQKNIGVGFLPNAIFRVWF